MKSIRYFDDCKSAERFARDWSITAGEADSGYDATERAYYAYHATGWQYLSTKKNVYPKMMGIRLKMKMKVQVGNLAGGQVVVKLGAEGYGRGIIGVVDTGSGLDGHWYWCQGSGSAGPSTGDVGWTDGKWHDFEIVIWNAYAWSLFVDGVCYVDHWSRIISPWLGFAFIGITGISVYKSGVKIKNIEVTDLSTDDYPAPITPLETVEVGNRKFLCELVKTWYTNASDSNVTGWTLGGTELPTHETDHLNIEGIIDANDQDSSCTIPVIKNMLIDRMLWMADVSFEDDDTSTDAWHLVVRGYTGSYYYSINGFNVRNLIEAGWGSALANYSGAMWAQNITLDASFTLVGQGYKTFKSARLGTIGVAEIQDIGHVELYATRPQGRPPAGDGGIWFWARHDAGEKHHIHVKNIKVYRIIAEVSP